MKKIKILNIVAVFCVLVVGCEDISQKKIENTKMEIENYIKNNMTDYWNYSNDKVLIDDDFTAKIKMYNIFDMAQCLLSAKEEYLSLKKHLDDKISLEKVAIYCENEEEKIGHVFVENIKKINIENYEKEIKLYDENSAIVVVNKDFYNMQKDIFISKCQNYSYKEIFRNSEKYISKYAVFTGEVIDVIEDKEYYFARVNVTRNEYGYYEDTIFASIPKSSFQGRVLAEDVITIYGNLSELTTYKSVLGTLITLPTINARYVELND